MKYTASLAIWYDGQWHLDPATETPQMDEHEAIIAGRGLGGAALVIYREYKNDIAGRAMIEFNGRLEPAFAELVA